MERLPTKYAAAATFGLSTILELLYDMRLWVTGLFDVKWTPFLVFAYLVVAAVLSPIAIGAWQLLTGG